MKKFTENIAVKITAVFLSFLVFISTVISVASCTVMLFNDFYTRDFSQIEKNIMGNLAESEAYNLAGRYQDGENYVQSYYKYKNVLYQIYNTFDDTEISNYTGQDYIASYSHTTYIERYYDKYGVYYNSAEVYYSDNGTYYQYAENNEVDAVQQRVEVTVYIPKDMQFTDRFFLVDKLITLGFNNRYLLIFTAMVSLILCIAVYSYLFVSVGHGGDDGIKVAKINNIPIDIFSCFGVLAFLVGTIMITEVGSLVPLILTAIFVVTVLYFISLWYLMSFAVQIKAKILLKHTALYWLFKKLKKSGALIKHIYKNLSTIYKVVIVMALFWFFEFIFIVFNAYENDNLIVGFIVLTAVVSFILIVCAIAFQRVKQGGEKIVNGDLENKIDTAYMFGDIKDFAESLNNINQGLQSAIDDKVKSERFKTELITNVSHDIKTPLTSIVNYVDLIQKEECDNEKINEYIEVLDRQSKRLKKLIEDLVEASKATTGNITVELTKCNLSVLINQAVGEFSQRLEDRNLQVIQNTDDDEVYILADGRRLWRVIDNLLNNICKYAMSGTRVYIDLKVQNGKAVMTFRNISQEPINVSANDLTERFVRGDRSRNTEGSGLGLSIAKSLTELQNGVFEISTDADLFKVKLVFDVME